MANVEIVAVKTSSDAWDVTIEVDFGGNVSNFRYADITAYDETQAKILARQKLMTALQQTIDALK